MSPPRVGCSPSGVSGDGGGRPVAPRFLYKCDGILVHYCGYPSSGRQPLPISTLMYNTFVGEMFAGGSLEVVGPVLLRNVKVGHPAVGYRLHIGEVASYSADTCVRNPGGRQTNTFGSSLRAFDAHHVGGLLCTRLHV